MERVVTVERLVKEYGPVTALAGVDLDIERGQIFGLLGPNGAGKTTLIRSVIGALRPTSGRVSVLGLDPLSDRWELRRRLGYMPQTPALYGDLTTRWNVAFFVAAHRRGDTESAVDEALAAVDLTDRADDPARTLSGGMKQRLSLACAIVHRPELIILDEPTSGIDPELRATFWNGFRELASAGTTVVVSTHQMGEALECDRVALLHLGDVVAVDDPRHLLRSSRARIRLWSGGEERSIELDDYPNQLRALLASEPADRVEIELERVDDIVLRVFRNQVKKEGTTS